MRQTTKPDVQLQKLHVAVVVDYKAGPDGKPLARTDKELAELTALARRPPASTTRAATRSRSARSRSRPTKTGAAAAAAAGQRAAAADADRDRWRCRLLGCSSWSRSSFAFSMRKRGGADDTRLLALPAPVGELERVLDARAVARRSAAREADPQQPAAGPHTRATA